MLGVHNGIAVLWYNISIVLTADSVVTGYAYFISTVRSTLRNGIFQSEAMLICVRRAMRLCSRLLNTSRLTILSMILFWRKEARANVEKKLWLPGLTSSFVFTTARLWNFTLNIDCRLKYILIRRLNTSFQRLLCFIIFSLFLFSTLFILPIDFS